MVARGEPGVPTKGVAEGTGGSGKDTLRAAAPAMTHNHGFVTFLGAKFGAPGQREKGRFSQNPGKGGTAAAGTLLGDIL